MSDDSSRVYESALESLSDATEDDHVSELPDLPMLKKQPSYKPIVNPAHVPLPQQQQPQQLPTQVQQTSQQLQQHHMQQQLQQDIIASGILSDASSRTVSPQYYTRKRANTGPSSGSSAITVTPLQAQNKQTLTPIAATHCEPQPMLPPPPQPAQTLLEDQQQQQQQQQKDEQEFLLRELKKQVELIEKQRIKDREEWNRKEQELLTHRHQMMETLIETKDQLTHVLKNREEENNKAKLTYYDKQLKQQQLHQMQKQVIEMGMTQQQQQQQEEDGVDEHLPAARLNSHYYQQSSYYYENDPEAPFDEHTMDDDEAPMYHQRRIRNRSKSDEHIKHNTRSSSRSSYHYQQQQHPIVDDGGRRSNNSRNNYTNEDIVPASNRKPVSRRASNASNKSSGAGHRFDHTSPATTLVSNHTVGKSRRPRARSIESTRWHEEQQHQQQQQQHMMVQYMDEMMVPYEKLRKSRSAGRDLHSMRPVSRASSVYNMYYDEGELMDDELFDSQPSFYDSGYYSNYMENIPPNKQQQQQMMSRYNSDIPYYPPQQQQQQPQPPHQYVYSPVDYYYQQQAQPRHNQRYSARHHYSYNWMKCTWRDKLWLSVSSINRALLNFSFFFFLYILIFTWWNQRKNTNTTNTQRNPV